MSSADLRGTFERTTALLFSILLVVSVMGGGIVGTAAGATTDAQQVEQLATSTGGDVLYRVNAGGSTVTATDGGSDWTPPGSTSGVTVGGSTSTYNTGDAISLDGTVPSSTPSTVFQTERFGDQQWEVNVTAGETYEVRLYFAEIYSTSSNERVFDVSVEGETVLNDYDIYADVGHDVGTMKSYTVTSSDGTIDVDLTTEVDNAKISAVEIVKSEPQPDVLGSSTSSVDFGTVVTGNSQTETITLSNLGNASNGSHPDITISDVSISGADAAQFSQDFSGSATLAPEESTTVNVTYAPGEAQPHEATLEVTHNGSNSPVTVDLSGEGSSDVPVGFGKSGLQGFSQGALTALEFGPDGRLYVAQQNGMVYALNVTRNGENSYSVTSQESIDAIQDIPNHDDNGTYVPGEGTRQVTGLTVGGTADQPVVYVSSSDPTIDVGTDDDDTDTNSGAISRLTFDWNSDGSLASVDHEVLVLGLPRSEENHATNGLDLSADGDTLYVAQGGNTNKGAPGNNFGHTPEYALSAAILEVDLAQIESNYSPKNLQSYDPEGSTQSYPDLTYYYAIPTVQTDDATDGNDLPFGGDDGRNQAKIVPGGPVQVFFPGLRNPYDVVVTEDGQIYTADNGPNGGWGGQPVNEGPSGTCTNAPNEDGSYGTGDQLHLAVAGGFGGHGSPIRANPDGAGLYTADGVQYFDFNASNTPVPFSMADPIQCDYQDPTEDSSLGDTFGWSAGIEEYKASNFGGAMQGDLLVVTGSSSVERVELNATGTGVTSQESNFFSDISALGINAQDDDERFPGTVWTARGGVTVFEPNDYGGTVGDTCSGADDPTLDEDGDGYDNADELDAGTDPCSAASTPPDFDGDLISNVNDPDDDNDGSPDTQDPFAVDADNGTTTTLPVQMEFSELSLFGDNSQGWTGVMTNGQTDYQDLYDPGQMTVGGAAEVLTVENVPKGDAVNNDQQFAFQRGFDAPDEPFTISTTVNGFPDSPQNYQGMGIYVGNGDQDNYLKLIVAANDGTGGIQFGKETGSGFQNVAQPDDPAVTGPGNNTDLSMTVYPSNDTVHAYYTPSGGEKTFVGSTTIPAEWLNSSDGTGTAAGVISTSYQASSTFDATWTHLYVDYVTPPANQPPTADAGADQTVDETTTVQLDASGSSDPDGDMLGYTWTQTAGPSVSLSANDAVNPTFTAPEVDGEATLTFQVSVSDGEAADTDTVNVTVQNVSQETLTIEEAVASYEDGGDDATISLFEIQSAINWWSTDATVPNTGGETISLTQMQQLINLWSTDATVGGNEAPTASLAVSPSTPTVGEQVTLDASGSTDPDGDALNYSWIIDGQHNHDWHSATVQHTFQTAGDHTVQVTVEDSAGNVDTASQTVTVSEATPATGSALVEITPDAGLEATTYGQGSYQVTNTGEKNISSVSFDLSSASLPDMVFDPNGTAGDPTGEGLNIVSDGGTNILTEPGTWEAFSEPHNDVDGDDGYDVMTVQFGDFNTGETATFWADNDPTSIKGATVGSQEAGPVSGLELARSTVTITYEDGTTQTTQLMGDGSAGGSTANVTADESAAPTIGAEGVTLDSGVLDARHSAATVTDAGQTITVTGQPGETVTLVRVEGELTLSNVPDSDGDGEPGYDIEAYEANDAENVEYYTVTLDSAGEATVPVTLTNTTSDGDNNAGYNYFTAVHGQPNADAGLASNVVVLKLEAPSGDTSNTAPTVEAISDQSVVSGENVNVSVSSSDADGDALTLAKTAGPSFVTLTDDGDGTGTLTIEPGADDAGTYTVEVTADDGTDQAIESFQLTVETAMSLTSGTVTDRVNVGESTTLSATDGGPDWTGVTGTGSPYLVSTSGGNGNYCGGDAVTPTSAVPSSTPDAVYNCERYGNSSWAFPVDAGEEVEVRLYLSNQFPQASEEGERQFNVSIEGQQVLTEYDPVADVGHANGTVKAFTVTDANGDGNVTVSFETGAVENPQVNAFEVVSVSSGGTTTGSTDVTVTSGGGIDSSTYSGGSFTVTNTGEKSISSVTFDLSESLVPDAVFDPNGTAGDATAKGLNIDSQSGDGVGVVSTADGDVFSQPHDGNSDDGYDVLTVEFSDFDPGETVAFSTDVDPTTIKDASTTGGAGSVSGLELSGSAVTVTYADSSTQANDLFEDGSSGGAQSTLDGAVASAPTLGVEGVALQSTDFPAHQAANVTAQQQNVTISGPAGATVTLLGAELSEPPTDGYDVDSFEGDNVQAVSTQTVTLDSNGEATVSVSLSSTNLNYIVASVEDGTSGRTSDAVILQVEGSA